MSIPLKFLSLVIIITLCLAAATSNNSPNKKDFAADEKESNNSQGGAPMNESATLTITQTREEDTAPLLPRPPAVHTVVGGSSASGSASCTITPMGHGRGLIQGNSSGLISGSGTSPAPRFPVLVGPGLSAEYVKNVVSIGWASEGSSKKQEKGNAEGGSSSSPGGKRSMPEEPQALVSELQCPVCGKTFSSRKAVFGHLRAHPERTWRGMSDAPNQQQPVFGSPQKSSADSQEHLQSQSAPTQLNIAQPPKSSLDSKEQHLQSQLAPTLLNIAKQTLQRISEQPSTSSGVASSSSRNFDLNAQPRNSTSPPHFPVPPQGQRGGGGGGAQAAFDLNLPPQDNSGNGNDNNNAADDDNNDNAANN